MIITFLYSMIMITGMLWHGPFSLQMFTRDTRKTHPCRWTRGCILCIIWELFLWCNKYYVILDHGNSLKLSGAYMRQSNIPALLQIMAYCVKPLPEPMLLYCQLDPIEHISVKFFFKFKSVCQMVAILSPPQCVNSLRLSDASMHQ